MLCLGEKNSKTVQYPCKFKLKCICSFFNYPMFNESEMGKPVALMKLSEDHSDLVAPFEAYSIK